MENDTQTLALMERTASIIRQLETESKFLDEVIESSLELQNLLREGRQATRPKATEPESDAAAQKAGASKQEPDTSKQNSGTAEPQPDIAARILCLKDKLAVQFQTIAEGREAMQQQIRSIELDSDDQKPLTAKQLARRVPDPQRGQLQTLRTELRAKLNRIKAITMGNQTVLVYTMDYYNRLLTGLSLRPAEAPGYDASGSSTSGSTHRVPGNFIQTTC